MNIKHTRMILGFIIAITSLSHVKKMRVLHRSYRFHQQRFLFPQRGTHWTCLLIVMPNGVLLIPLPRGCN